MSFFFEMGLQVQKIDVIQIFQKTQVLMIQNTFIFQPAHYYPNFQYGYILIQDHLFSHLYDLHSVLSCLFERLRSF